MVVKNSIEDVIKPYIKKNVLNILDVGGYKGRSQELFDGDMITVLDVYDIKEASYIRGDGASQPFNDEEYDISVNFDVLEHIPRSKRERFLPECLRIAKYGMFVSAPIDNKKKDVSEAERKVNNIYKLVQHKDHKWLKEHADNKLPTEVEVERLFKNKKMFYTKTSSNPLIYWSILQSTFFILSAIEPDEKQPQFTDAEFYSYHKTINSLYNSKLNKYELVSLPSYRKIYFVSKDRRLVRKMNKYWNKRETTKTPETIIDDLGELINVAQSTIAKMSALLNKSKADKND